MSKLVLGQTLTTEMPGRSGGSRAAAMVHDAVRRDILAADARRLSTAISHQLVRPYIDLNFGPQKVYPKFWLGLPDDSDVKVFADVVAELVDRGLEVSQRAVLDKLGLPEVQEGETTLRPQGQSSSEEDDPESGEDEGNTETSAAQKKSPEALAEPLLRRSERASQKKDRWKGY